MEDYVDDPSIEDTADLWRRITPEWVVFDENAGTWRITSQAFQDRKDGPMSALIAAEDSIERALRAWPSYGIAAFPAGSARNQKLGIKRDPTPADASHAVVFGKKTGGVKNALVRASRLLVVPATSFT